MNFLINDAMAAAPAAPAGPQGDPIMQLLPFVLLFVVFYFLLIRPQSKRAKEHKNMVSNLAKGDEVVTSGGVLGRIADLDENYVSLEIANNVTISIQRNAVTTLVPKGTFKTN